MLTEATKITCMTHDKLDMEFHFTKSCKVAKVLIAQATDYNELAGCSHLLDLRL